MKIFALKSGEKVVATLTRKIKDIESGVIIGIGALTSADIGIYDLKKKKYANKTFKGNLEIGSFTATISSYPDGKVGLHPHIIITSQGFSTVAGHLNEGVVGATFEAIVISSNKKIARYFDQKIGLNLIKTKS